jgi:septum formation inhibitor-activating ATPase MinD
MAVSRNGCSWAVVLKFTLIIIISACIAGIVGGVTSQVSKFKAASVVLKPANTTVNGTMRVVGRIGRVWVG